MLWEPQIWITLAQELRPFPSHGHPSGDGTPLQKIAGRMGSPSDSGDLPRSSHICFSILTSTWQVDFAPDSFRNGNDIDHRRRSPWLWEFKTNWRWLGSIWDPQEGTPIELCWLVSFYFATSPETSKGHPESSSQQKHVFFVKRYMNSRVKGA